MMKTFFLTQCFLVSFSASAADWSREAQLPGGDGRKSPHHRANIYQLSPESWEESVNLGRLHAFHYPVTITELNIPFKALKDFLDAEPNDPLKKWIYQISQKATKFESTQDVMDWLGIQAFPENENQRGPGPWPEVSPGERELGMGATILDMNGAEALTFSCAACHSADLFGKKVVGLTNRFPRANEFFRAGKKLLPFAHPDVFRSMTGATDAEVEILKKSRYAVQFVGAKKPEVLGLDTSLAQVALSLARRAKDPYAERKAWNAQFPRSNPLDKKIADSKPAVWWNVKYKTRWLSDGSIVQGNPIHTNFLWNEIGRGVDLHVLEKWLTENQQVIDDLTAAVFAVEAPAYLDFLPEDTFNERLARQGQPVFKNNCASCHGHYEKAWDQPLANLLPLKERVKTTAVWYHKKTPVIDVGTDPGRYEGMQYFAKELNALKISQAMKTVVEPQKGYVPPPLVGIWARWPYFHNNSAPNLCAVLTRASERLVTYVAGPALDPRTDYDADCGGYPTGMAAPAAWKKDKDYLYDTRREGLRNTGHDEKIFLEDGVETMTAIEKRALIEFLKTL
jgi:mono/diheme cytochrome c family protein